MDPPIAIDPDDALAQPTRARLFALLGELKRAAGTLELARALGLHPNGVRVHLERLEEAGLLLRSRAPQPRGRPRDAWIIAPGARPGGAAPRGYADLGRWLVRALPSGSGEAPDVQAVGRTIGRDIAPRDADADPDPLHSTLSALGFHPTSDGDHDGRRQYLLRNCPYRDAAQQNPGLVCGLHRGITQGLLEVLAPQSELAAFVPHEPDVAGCRIEIVAADGRERR
ncbi:MAG: helix-turn-helix domain-containing protein [Solirubrobacteraceae bacterium]|nr:helix-turn-helix domain-containing protein [Solirubrobacteraceae bacterium]